MKSFWNNDHPRQSEYDKAYRELVPSQGDAMTVKGQLLRYASRLYYDFFNNGNGNVRDWQDDAYYDFELETEVSYPSSIEVSEYGAEALTYIGLNLSHSAKIKIKDIILREEYYKFSDKDTAIYDNMIEEVLDYIKNN